MDPLVKAISRIRREVEKTVAMVEGKEDKLLIINTGLRKLDELKTAVQASK